MTRGWGIYACAECVLLDVGAFLTLQSACYSMLGHFWLCKVALDLVWCKSAFAERLLLVAILPLQSGSG